MRTFESWLAQFRQSIATFAYYEDFGKVIQQAKRHKAELHLMNSLVGEQDIETSFRELVAAYPSVLKCIPEILAVREVEIFGRDEDQSCGKWYVFNGAGNENTVDEYCEFMRKTGLFDLISRHLVNNLYDYVVGVEAGLDSNGRKNRGGHLMEDMVERFLIRAGVAYRKEMYASEVEQEYGVDLSPMTNNGKAKKRFDFVVKTPTCVYAIETNFYQSSRDYRGGGSKLNETAKSYKLLALEARRIPHFKFVWITDGGAWRNAQNNLRETFEVLPDIYNIKELEEGVAEKIFI